MRKKLILLSSAIVLLITMSATTHLNAHGGGQGEQSAHDNPTNAIYHWKTVFNPSAEELSFIQRHSVGRLYIRMFDIALADDHFGNTIPAPIATTRFDATTPKGVEVIPTTYITLDALKAMHDNEAYYAELIVDRLMAMASYNECGTIDEVQFDCDWTESTTEIYYALCEYAEAYLNEMGMDLSITVRLHQIDDGIAPKADRGVLMLYNTGAVKDIRTKNSILDIADIKPYLRSAEYPLPLDFAYPTFSWGVKFKNGVFLALVSDPSTATLAEGETIREESVSTEEILTAKEWVESALGLPYQCNIIYHLDENELKNYNDNEISEIYSRN
jgi:hypothetical protein